MCLRNLCVCIWVYVPPHEALTNDKMLKCERERNKERVSVFACKSNRQEMGIIQIEKIVVFKK